MANKTEPPVPSLFTTTTVLSLLSTLAILLTAYGASVRLLPRSTTTKLRILYIWHLFDALIHLILEASFLYNCFFTSIPVSPVTSDYPHPASIASSFFPFTPPDVFFLGDRENLYGSLYGSNPFAQLWQEYARADKRWGGADLTVISLELVTVLLAGPLAVYVAELVRRGGGSGSGGAVTGKLWFWASVLAAGELYGGFMTFAPEWLSGNTNLVTSNFMYKWVYLFFFNTLWVWFPLWVLYEAFKNIIGAFTVIERDKTGKKGI